MRFSIQKWLNRCTQERKPTDVSALYFCIGFIILIFGGFVGYAGFHGSIYRLVNGIDDCGNVCGRKNDYNTINFCGPSDKQILPFTLVNVTVDSKNPNITYTHSTCVKRCSDYPGFIEIVNRCSFVNGSDSTQTDNGSFVHEIGQDLLNSWSPILISCIVALVFSNILLVLFRYAIKWIIWIIPIGLIVVLLIGCIAFIVMYFNEKNNGSQSPDGFLIVAAAFALIAIILGFVIFLFRKRIRLVIQLFKEASKALGGVPLIIAEPLLTFLALCLSTFSFLYIAVVIESSGHLEIEKDEKGNFDKATYNKDFAMTIARYVNLGTFIWFIQFIFGCQHFVIAGTVCQWFFARDKTKLDSPIIRSFNCLLRFHIGSICIGSIFITIVKIISYLVKNAKNSTENSRNTFGKGIACCCDCLIKLLEQLLQYLVRNAYIIIALDGTPIFDSGKKAFRLLKENLINVIALNKCGNFVLFLGRVFVVLIAGFVSCKLVANNDSINLKFMPIILSVFFAYLVVHCFMTVYEMTLDTIFICFCVDCEENDGTSRPYFMSRNMMDVMMELKDAAGGAFKHDDASTQPMIPYGSVEAGAARPIILSNYQFYQ